MNNNKQLIWDLLAGNYAGVSHVWGKQLLELSQRRRKQAFHDRADECISQTLSWPVEARSRALKTWLSHYQLPFEPEHMASFDDFHKTTSLFIFANSRHLSCYEEPVDNFTKNLYN